MCRRKKASQVTLPTFDVVLRNANDSELDEYLGYREYRKVTSLINVIIILINGVSLIYEYKYSLSIFGNKLLVSYTNIPQYTDKAI